jgi:hypothetical protein
MHSNVSHLLLEGTDRMQGLLGRTRWPTVPEVNYPDKVGVDIYGVIFIIILGDHDPLGSG